MAMPGQDEFLVEAKELCDDLTASLFAIEKDPENSELINKIFRALHTIKGSSAMFGFDELSKFTHSIESTYELIRNKTIPLSVDIINLTFQALDVIGQLISTDPTHIHSATQDTITKQFESIAGIVREEKDKLISSQNLKELVLETDSVYRIRFVPQQTIFFSGTNPLLLFKELKTLGECTIVALTEKIPLLDTYVFDQCYTSWDIIITTRNTIDALRDVFIFVEDNSKVSIELIIDDTTDGSYKRLGEILVEKQDVTTDIIQNAVSTQPKIGKLLVQQAHVEPSKIDAALAEQEFMRSRSQNKKAIDEVSSIRVSSLKIDMLVNLAGEMVTTQARLSELAHHVDDPILESIAEEIDRLTSVLRDNVMSIRMLPIGTTFNKYKRVVRDISRELGKEVELLTFGGDTEIDKTVIEQLENPLVHLLRNSVDHGIESPQDRVNSGKNSKGTITLKASPQGSSVLIEITDDGKGMNLEAITNKAIEKGIIKSASEMTEKQLLNLIFEPGFSTAQKVTQISGRGVGMDVVKKKITDLRGTVDVSTVTNKGSTITMKIPLTVAIIDGLLVKVSDDFYLLPLSTVEECIELPQEIANRSNQKNIINIRGEIIPFIYLRDQFGISGDPPEVEQIAICRYQNLRVGFVLDKIIGGHQTVIKRLSKIYKNSKEFSGATILGDGTVALIIDPVGMINAYQSLRKTELVDA